MRNRMAISAEANYSPGSVIHLDTSRNSAKAMFRDDGARATFSALQNSNGRYEEVDSVDIHLQGEISAHKIPAHGKNITAQIAWSSRGCMAMLLVNHRPLAVFDFLECRGYSCAPSQAGAQWRRHHHPWSDELLSSFGR